MTSDDLERLRQERAAALVGQQLRRWYWRGWLTGAAYMGSIGAVGLVALEVVR